LVLEQQQLYLANEKLKREVEPENWWSKLAKNVVAVGGVATVLGAIWGVWDSYDKTINDREHTRIAEAHVRLEDALKRLESHSTISKLVGISILSGYLNKRNADLHPQILFALASFTATDTDQQTQRAIVDLIAAIPAEGVIKKEDWNYFQDILVSQSRALMAKGDLLHHRRFTPNSSMKDEEKAAQAIGNLISLNVRKGVAPRYEKYNGIYCVDCNFSGATFPNKVDFTGAVLDGANFNAAKLPSASFDNAELLRSTFIGATLMQAKFRSVISAENLDASVWANPPVRTAYIDHIASALAGTATIDVIMPNFSCANLEGADFESHALFPIPGFSTRFLGELNACSEPLVLSSMQARQ
jgi:hypothetical protein